MGTQTRPVSRDLVWVSHTHLHSFIEGGAVGGARGDLYVQLHRLKLPLAPEKIKYSISTVKMSVNPLLYFERAASSSS